MDFFEIAKQYLQLGYTHVIPLGFDHILFILSIFFLNSNVRSVIIQCSVFTLAHSLSLGLTASGFIMPNSNIVEPLIALSILFASIENIVHSKVNAWRLIIIFFFGIIHGMGFASALKEIGLPSNNFWDALISFNFGVEFGQITIILLAYFLISKWFSGKVWYRERIVYPVSSVIACIALYWTINRL
jgi:hypothetical protein